MKRVAVKFERPDQIIDFVRIMNRYEYDADVKCGSRIVDAKSIVGVLALAKSKTVEVIVHTDDACRNLWRKFPGMQHNSAEGTVKNARLTF